MVFARTKVLRIDPWDLRGFSGACMCECAIEVREGTKSGSKSVKNPDTPIFSGFFGVFRGSLVPIRRERVKMWSKKGGSKSDQNRVFFGFFRVKIGVHRGVKI